MPVRTVAVGDGLPLGDGHGLAEALGLADGDGVAERAAPADADAEAVAAGLALAPGLADGVGAAQAKGGEAMVRRVLLTFWLLPPPLSKRATGTTISPMRTVITNAAAPHSRRQKSGLEVRIRARRPFPVGACSSC